MVGEHVLPAPATALITIYASDEQQAALVCVAVENSLHVFRNRKPFRTINLALNQAGEQNIAGEADVLATKVMKSCYVDYNMLTFNAQIKQHGRKSFVSWNIWRSSIYTSSKWFPKNLRGIYVSTISVYDEQKQFEDSVIMVTTNGSFDLSHTILVALRNGQLWSINEYNPIFLSNLII